MKTVFMYIILLRSFQVSWQVSWFQVGIGGWIYQNCLEHFRTLHKPSSRVVCVCKGCF